MSAPEQVEALREEAIAWVEKHGHSGIFSAFPNRSCWECNPAHDWMRHDMETPYHCFACGRIFFKGVDLTEPEVTHE